MTTCRQTPDRRGAVRKQLDAVFAQFYYTSKEVHSASLPAWLAAESNAGAWRV